MSAIAEQNARLRASDFDRRHGRQLASASRGEALRGAVCHQLADIVLQLIVESIDALASATSASTTRAAVAIALLVSALTVVFRASRMMSLALFARLLRMLSILAGHGVLL
jgi:hypothetical protein